MTHRRWMKAESRAPERLLPHFFPISHSSRPHLGTAAVLRKGEQAFVTVSFNGDLNMLLSEGSGPEDT